MVTFTINIPPMLAYIPAPWILWVMMIQQWIQQWWFTNNDDLHIIYHIKCNPPIILHYYKNNYTNYTNGFSVSYFQRNSDPKVGQAFSGSWQVHQSLLQRPWGSTLQLICFAEDNVSMTKTAMKCYELVWGLAWTYHFGMEQLYIIIMCNWLDLDTSCSHLLKRSSEASGGGRAEPSSQAGTAYFFFKHLFVDLLFCFDLGLELSLAGPRLIQRRKGGDTERML